MPNSNSFMAGKLRIPDSPKDVDADSSPTELKLKKTKSEPEKPWIGQSSLRQLEKRNAERLKVDSDNQSVPEVPKVDIVPNVQRVPKAPGVDKVSNQLEQSPIAPVKNFHRVSNSINSQALEGGMFTRPSCKQVYDALYLLTRGAIQPSRTIQIGRKQLQKKAGIGSDKTLDAAVISLQAVGLLRVNVAFGSQKGNIYEVLLPEEITIKNIIDNKAQSRGTMGTEGTSGTTSTLGQKTPNVPSVVSTYGTRGQTIDSIDSYQAPNTSFKTNTKNDDEKAFAPFIEKFQKACEQLTGAKLSERDADKLSDLADLLILQLQTAARKTNNVSNAPAFLTEVLRRKLLNVQPATSPAKTKTDIVGKSEGSYEIKPLDKKGRESALNELHDFAGDPMLKDFKKWYTSEDWEWLIKELAKINLTEKDFEI